MGLKPELVKNEENVEPVAEAMPIPKPTSFNLDKFKSKRSVAIANVGTMQDRLPILKISHAKDFVMTHPDEENYWSVELCFVNVPVKGQKQGDASGILHLIDEELAVLYLPSARIQRFRLALATKPFDVFFFCQVPTRNEDNAWNISNLQACEMAKTQWTQATSRKAEGAEGYKIDFAQDHGAFPEPKWPNISLSELLGRTFAGRIVEHERDPALLRLIGAKQ